MKVVDSLETIYYFYITGELIHLQRVRELKDHLNEKV